MQFSYPSNPKQWKRKGRATSDQTVCWLSLSVLKSVLTYISTDFSLYCKTNYDSPQRTIELLASSFSKPKYLETRIWILKKSINFTEHECIMLLSGRPGSIAYFETIWHFPFRDPVFHCLSLNFQLFVLKVPVVCACLKLFFLICWFWKK